MAQTEADSTVHPVPLLQKKSLFLCVFLRRILFGGHSRPSASSGLLFDRLLLSQSENCDSLAFLSKSAVLRLSESIWVPIAAGYCFTPPAFCCGRLDLGWEAAPTHLVPESADA